MPCRHFRAKSLPRRACGHVGGELGTFCRTPPSSGAVPQMATEDVVLVADAVDDRRDRHRDVSAYFVGIGLFPRPASKAARAGEFQARPYLEAVL